MKIWSKLIAIVMTLVMTAISVPSVSAFPNLVGTKSDSGLPQVITPLLSDYGKLISSGTTDSPSYYMPMMLTLANERRAYYQEYFDVGLHSKLISIRSNFQFDGATANLDISSNQILVSISETVDFNGRYNIVSIDDFPLIKASKWSLAKVNTALEKEEINSRIKSLEEDLTRSSSSDGFNTSFIVRHEILISNNGSNSQILQDSFTDQSSDNGTGYDNIQWKNGTFIRSKPDLTQSPTYIWWNKKSTEELGQDYLNNVAKTLHARNELSKVEQSKSPNQVMRPLTSIYNRTNAHWYADNYTSNPTSGSCGVTYMDQSKWNSAYTKYCADCANYVSQVLKYGGIPTSSLWQKDTTDWIQVVPLHQYMVAYYYATTVSNMASLYVGDFMETDDQGHVVILTSLTPPTFSGHTNDRKDYTTVGMGFTTYFYHITY